MKITLDVPNQVVGLLLDLVRLEHDKVARGLQTDATVGMTRKEALEDLAVLYCQLGQITSWVAPAHWERLHKQEGN